MVNHRKKSAERQRSLISRVECGTHCLGTWTTDGSKGSTTWKSGKIQEGVLIGRDEVDIFGETGRFIIKRKDSRIGLRSHGQILVLAE